MKIIRPLLAIMVMTLISCNSKNKINSETVSDVITEKYWKLKTLEGQDVKMLNIQEQAIFFSLNTNENRVTGFAGCNSLSGAFSLEKRNRIRFTNMATTLKICPDVAVNESEFLEVFELADNYTIKDDVLSLNIGRRAPLAIFEATIPNQNNMLEQKMKNLDYQGINSIINLTDY